MATRTIANQLHNLHIELEFLERKLNHERVEWSGSDWTAAIERHQLDLLAIFQAAIGDDAQLQRRLTNDGDRQDALLLLQHEISTHGDKCIPDLLNLLQRATDRALRVSYTPVFLTPTWFIPPHELDVLRAKSEPTSRLVQGKWLESVVMIKEFTEAQIKFAEDIDRWFDGSM